MGNMDLEAQSQRLSTFNFYIALQPETTSFKLTIQDGKTLVKHSCYCIRWNEAGDLGTQVACRCTGAVITDKLGSQQKMFFFQTIQPLREKWGCGRIRMWESKWATEQLSSRIWGNNWTCVVEDVFDPEMAVNGPRRWKVKSWRPKTQTPDQLRQTP